MESTNNVINLIKRNVYMASVDVKYAFFSVPCFKLLPRLMTMDLL